MKRVPKLRAVIFDLDGTLASFNVDYASVRADVRAYLIQSGIPASILALNESIFDMLKKAEVLIRNHEKPTRLIGKLRREASRIAEEYEYEAAQTTSLLPGVEETLADLKEMGLRLGLCTINSEKSMDYILKRFNLRDCFDALVPRNKVKYVKPDPEHLETALEMLKIEGNEAMVVGDSRRDMQCATDVGAIAIGLTTGIGSADQLSEAGANYVITSLLDLPKLITQICGFNKNIQASRENHSKRRPVRDLS